MNDGTADSHDQLSRWTRWLPGMVALVASVGVLILIITGRTDGIAPVAALGTAAIAGGTLQVTINIRH
ncbi:hypothetical protein [Streptomyces malaysiensis]|uniref:hypothetical protein n=1 Tax=Streptomyces malaysiensis TaxID=92644 RepID=UPI00114CDAA4|nr:hypothetical protein [Streptomyces sp. SPMA113]